MIKNSLDKNQMFVFNLLIRAITNNVNYIDVNYVSEQFNLDYKNTKKLIATLVDLKITKFKKANDIHFVFVPIAQVIFEDGKAFFESPSKFLEIVREKERYTTFDMKVQRQLTSKYAYMMYEIASLCYNNKNGVGYTEKYTPQEFKELLGLGDSEYNEYKHLKNQIINKSIKGLKDKTDFKLTLKEIKAGNKVNQIYFEIKKKDVKDKNLLQQETEVAHNKETPLINEELESKYTTEQITKAKEKLEKAKQITEIKNDTKYIEKILINQQNKDSFTLTPKLEKELKYKLLLSMVKNDEKYFIEMSEPYEYYDNSHFEEAVSKMRSFKKNKNVDLGSIYSLRSSDIAKCYKNWEKNIENYKNRIEFCNSLLKIGNYIDIDIANIIDMFKV